MSLLVKELLLLVSSFDESDVKARELQVESYFELRNA